MNDIFDDIRSFRDAEIPEKVQQLAENKVFMNLLGTIFPLVPEQVLRARFAAIQTVEEFQRGWDYPFLSSLEATKTHGISLAGLENAVPSKAHIFLSNHRDIILDAAFFCIKLMENGRDTVEVAIGDNLLVYEWIRDLVRINKSFIVHRSLNIRELLESSRRLSAYIRHDIVQRGQSVWLAQREGRAKNSDDRTQESIIKMLCMSGTGSIFENIKSLNINPLSISYEYDPCDYLKAREMQQRRDNPDFHKTPQDDINNMVVGVMGFKGRVVFRIAESIENELDMLEKQSFPKAEIFRQIAALIDRSIFRNYEIYAVNKIAFDLLERSQQFEKQYSLQEKLDFERYLQLQIQKIDLPQKDEDFLRTKILEMYANPLKNHLSV